MTGTHLKADIGQIRSSADAVAAIKSALEGSESLVDQYADAIGQSSLSGALHTFATNWKIHREKMCGDLNTFSTWAHKAADEYEKTDGDLAKALTSSRPGGQGAS